MTNGDHTRNIKVSLELADFKECVERTIRTYRRLINRKDLPNRDDLEKFDAALQGEISELQVVRLFERSNGTAIVPDGRSGDGPDGGTDALLGGPSTSKPLRASIKSSVAIIPPDKAQTIFSFAFTPTEISQADIFIQSIFHLDNDNHPSIEGSRLVGWLEQDAKLTAEACGYSSSDFKRLCNGKVSNGRPMDAIFSRFGLTPPNAARTAAPSPRGMTAQRNKRQPDDSTKKALHYRCSEMAEKELLSCVETALDALPTNVTDPYKAFFSELCQRIAVLQIYAGMKKCGFQGEICVENNGTSIRLINQKKQRSVEVKVDSKTGTSISCEQANLSPNKKTDPGFLVFHRFFIVSDVKEKKLDIPFDSNVDGSSQEHRTKTPYRDRSLHPSFLNSAIIGSSHEGRLSYGFGGFIKAASKELGLDWTEHQESKNAQETWAKQREQPKRKRQNGEER
jgi:hypothetical protein